jgi:hypothetical protein
MTKLQKNIDDIGYAIDAYQPEFLNTLDDVRDSDIQDTIKLIEDLIVNQPIDNSNLGIMKSSFGMVAAVDSNGNIKKATTGKGKSWSNKEIEVDENVLQPVFSMGKLMLGLVVGAMGDRGVLSPQTRMGDILPDWNPIANKIKILRNVRREVNDNTVVCDSKNGTTLTIVNNGVIVNKTSVEDELEPLSRNIRVHDLMVHTGGFVGTIFQSSTGELSSDSSLISDGTNSLSYAQAVLEYPDKLGIMGFQPGESFAYDASHFVLIGFIEIVYNLRLNPKGVIRDPNHPDFKLFDELFQDLIGEKIGLTLGDDYFVSYYPRNKTMNQDNILGITNPPTLHLTGNITLARKEYFINDDGDKVYYAYTSALPANGAFDIAPNALGLILHPNPDLWNNIFGHKPLLRAAHQTPYFTVKAYAKLFFLIIQRGMHQGNRIISERWMFIMEQPNIQPTTDMQNPDWSILPFQAATYGYGLGSRRQYANVLDSGSAGYLLPGEMTEGGITGLKGYQLGDVVVFSAVMCLTYGQVFRTDADGIQRLTVEPLLNARQVMQPFVDSMSMSFMRNTKITQRKRTLYSAQSVVPSI